MKQVKLLPPSRQVKPEENLFAAALGLKTNDTCPKCMRTAQGWEFKNYPKNCNGTGAKWWIFCGRFQGIYHEHYKCWHCNAKYFRAKTKEEQGKPPNFID